MEKRGQFYLMAAIIIVVVILGAVAVTNFVRDNDESELYETGKELGVEGAQVLDFGVVNNDVDKKALFEHFSYLYDTYTGADKEIYYIFGTEDPDKPIVAYRYTDFIEGEISIYTISGTQTFEVESRENEPLEVIKTTEGLQVIINGQPYEFEVEGGDYFYFVISKDIGDERYVVTS